MDPDEFERLRRALLVPLPSRRLPSDLVGPPPPPGLDPFVAPMPPGDQSVGGRAPTTLPNGAIFDPAQTRAPDGPAYRDPSLAGPPPPLLGSSSPRMAADVAIPDFGQTVGGVRTEPPPGAVAPPTGPELVAPPRSGSETARAQVANDFLSVMPSLNVFPNPFQAAPTTPAPGTAVFDPRHSPFANEMAASGNRLLNQQGNFRGTYDPITGWILGAGGQRLMPNPDSPIAPAFNYQQGLNEQERLYNARAAEHGLPFMTPGSAAHAGMPSSLQNLSEMSRIGLDRQIQFNPQSAAQISAQAHLAGAQNPYREQNVLNNFWSNQITAGQAAGISPAETMRALREAGVPEGSMFRMTPAGTGQGQTTTTGETPPAPPQSLATRISDAVRALRGTAAFTGAPNARQMVPYQGNEQAHHDAITNYLARFPEINAANYNEIVSQLENAMPGAYSRWSTTPLGFSNNPQTRAHQTQRDRMARLLGIQHQGNVFGVPVVRQQGGFGGGDGVFDSIMRAPIWPSNWVSSQAPVSTFPTVFPQR